MKIYEKLGISVLHQFDPERAHNLSLTALRSGLLPKTTPFSSPRLKTELAGISLPNPVGLAAGYDKNATAIAPLLQVGFGFVEVGAATPRPQPGNPKPRLFRLSEDRAVINRFGFNNEGADAIAARLARRNDNGIVGLNLGANKDSDDRAADYIKVLQTCGAHIDFATVNVSSPNTEKLRDLQGAAALDSLLSGIRQARDEQFAGLPLFLKIAPDLTDAEIAEIAKVAIDNKIDAIIATNTTLDRDGLNSAHKDEKGGLSGRPLFEKSTRVLARLARETSGAMPLIGVGGIASPDDAYAKIKAGASAVQLYSALVYQGLSLVDEIARGLDARLAADGFENITDATGIEKENYA